MTKLEERITNDMLYYEQLFKDEQRFPDWDTRYDFEKVFDKGGIADVSTDRMTVPSDGAGLWWMSAAVQVNNFRAQRNILNFFINGSTTGGQTTGDNFENGKWDESGHYSTSTGAVLMNLSAGDYVTAHFYQNGGSTEIVVNRNFTAWYLGPSS